MRFAAIDFETANYRATSMCSAGIAVFTDGNLVFSRQWLVRPPIGHGYFRPDFIEIHGITHGDVYDAPHFDTIAGEFLPILRAADFVVAHNASFDMRVLQATLEYFDIDCPNFDCRCSLKASREAWPELPSHRLNVVAEHLGLVFNHHDAKSDAETAGMVMLAAMRRITYAPD